jgi:hypothetical protein
MRKLAEVRSNPRIQKAYATYNMGILRDIHRTRRQAIEELERQCGEPWVKCKRYMEIHKVIVSKIP